MGIYEGLVLGFTRCSTPATRNGATGSVHNPASKIAVNLTDSIYHFATLT